MRKDGGFKEEGNWYKGNLHSHTVDSDGCLTPREAVELFVEHGYSFLGISDHDVYSDYREQLNREDFIIIPAVEASAVLWKDDTLTQLYAQEDALQSKVDQAKTEVVAPYSGVVSFYLDGRESLLNPESMAELTYETVETVTKDAKAKGSTDANPQMPLFRVVNNAKWYVLILSDGGAVELNAGQSVNLNFSGYAGVDYAGTCTDVRPSGDNALYVIEMSQDIGALLSERNLDVTVGKQMEGLKIPASALQTQEGVRGVYVIDGQAKIFVPVKVLVEDGSAAIVEALGSENQLEVNQLVQIK